jgi:hypothetical protein
MWMNPDLKVYNTDIYLEGNEPLLRNGMSCKADIIVEQYQDVVYIPVHAVLRVEGQPTVYVVKDGKIEERKVEIGLDNNRMVTITSGLNEGEVVSLAPPLKAATVESGSQMLGTGAPGSTDTMMQKINEKLKAANGTETSKPGSPSDNAAGPQQEGPGRPMGPGRDDTGQERTAGEGLQAPSTDQVEQMRQRFENMTPEEKQKEMEKMKQRFQNMTPEEREKMRQQRSQGTGGRRQAGRQGEGQGQGQSQGQGPERNQ